MIYFKRHRNELNYRSAWLRRFRSAQFFFRFSRRFPPVLRRPWTGILLTKFRRLEVGRGSVDDARSRHLSLLPLPCRALRPPTDSPPIGTMHGFSKYLFGIGCNVGVEGQEEEQSNILVGRFRTVSEIGK